MKKFLAMTSAILISAACFGSIAQAAPSPQKSAVIIYSDNANESLIDSFLEWLEEMGAFDNWSDDCSDPYYYPDESYCYSD